MFVIHTFTTTLLNAFVCFYWSNVQQFAGVVVSRETVLLQITALVILFGPEILVTLVIIYTTICPGFIVNAIMLAPTSSQMEEQQ